MAPLPTVQDKTTAIPSVVNSISDTTQPQANKTLGSLAEGAGSLFDTAMKAESAREDRSMSRRAYELVDEKRKDLGVDDAAMNSRIGIPVKGAVTDNEDNFGQGPLVPGDTDGAGSGATDFSGRRRVEGDEPLPTAGETMVARAARMQRAVEAGKLGNSEYSAGLEAIVRQLRAEYPGSREEIDQKISQITGQTPANALRASMLRDQITAQRAANTAQTYERNYRDKNAKYAPDLVDAPFDQFRHAVVGAQAQEHAVTQATASLNLASKSGENQGVQATKVLSSAVSAGADKVIGELSAPLEKMLSQKEPLTNQQIEGARPQLQILRARLEQGFEAMADRPVDYDPAHPEYKGKGPTLRTLINDPNKIAAMKKDVLARVDDLENQFTNEFHGSFNFNKNSAKTSIEAADAGLMRKDHMAVLASVNTRFGPNVANLVLTPTDSGPQVLPMIQKTILDAGKLQAVTKGGDTPSQTAEKMETAALKPNQPPVTASAYREQMKGLVHVMTSKDIPDEARLEAVQKVTQDAKYLYKFNAGYGQVQAYTTLYSPEVSRSVKELSLPDPKVWNEYRGAAVSNFIGVYKSAAADAQAVNKVEGYHTEFNPEAGQFKVVADKGRGPIEDEARKANLEVYQDRVSELNRGMRTLTEVLKLDKQEVGPQLLQIAKAIGVDPNVAKEGFWSGISQAVEKTVQKVGEATERNIKG